MMKIIREKPCQRRHHRVTAPMKVTMPNGNVQTATDWSLGGLRLDGVKGQLPSKGQEWKMTFELPFQGFDISFDVEAEVVRTDAENGTVALEYKQLSERAHDLMSHFIEDLIRGKMATVEDTICRIDVPVTPISTKPDPNPAGELPARRLPIKTIVMSMIYISLAVFVFGYLAVLAYSYTMRIEIKSAVVSAPLATVNMPVDGLLLPVRLQEDVLVSKGDAIAHIKNPDLEADIENQRIEVEQAKRALHRTEEKYRIEAARMKLYQVINKTDRQIAEARVLSAQEGLASVDARYERSATLAKKGLMAKSKLDVVARERAEAEARLKEMEYQLERAIAMDSVSDRRYYNHKEFVTDLDMLQLEIDDASMALNAAKTKLANLENNKAELIIRAPFDGRIVSVKQLGNTQVLRNQQLFTVEKLDTPTVTAFLNQDQVLHIGLNDKAKVFLPSLGKHITASVKKIDRNSAFLNSKASHYTWSEGKEKSASVSLNLEVSADEYRRIHAGLPAVVIFSKRQTNDIYNLISTSINPSVEELTDGSSI